MITEGIGRKAPQFVASRLTEGDRRQLYRLAIERSEHRNYANGNSQWKRGLKGELELPGIGTLTESQRPIYVGMCGEYAVQRYVDSRFPVGHGCKLDTELTAAGDFGVDLVAYGCKMQVKTRQRSNGETLYKRSTEYGRILDIPTHVCVFCEWTEPHAPTYMVGWQWADAIKELPLIKSHRGNWCNAEVADELLLPMSALADELEAWRAAKLWR